MDDLFRNFTLMFSYQKENYFGTQTSRETKEDIFDYRGGNRQLHDSGTRKTIKAKVHEDVKCCTFSCSYLSRVLNVIFYQDLLTMTEQHGIRYCETGQINRHGTLSVVLLNHDLNVSFQH